MNDEELKEIIRNFAVEVRMDSGEANLTGVLKNFLTQHPDMKTEIRKKLPLVKEIIAEINTMEQADLSEFGDISTDALGEDTSEYEMLVSLFKTKIEKDNELSKSILSLIIYGSYAKRLHVVGESDINFVLVIKDGKSEGIIEKVNEIAESIITPELSHIFDLMILKKGDIAKVEEFREIFTHIHALYAKDGEVLIGVNDFKDDLEISDEKIKEASKLMILDAIGRIEEVVQTAKEEELPEAELEYLLGASIIDIAFSLCVFQAGIQCSERDLVKPDIHEEFKEIFEKDSSLMEFNPLLQQAHAFKLSIRLPETINFIDTAYKFVNKALEYTGLLESE